MRKKELCNKYSNPIDRKHANLVAHLKLVLNFQVIAVLPGEPSDNQVETSVHHCKWAVNHTTSAMLNISLIATINQHWEPQSRVPETNSVLRANAAPSCLHTWSSREIQIPQIIKMHQTTILHLTSASIAIMQVCKLGLVGTPTLIFNLMVKLWGPAWQIRNSVLYHRYHILQILGLKETLILIT
jgi:hypothetical protein